MDYLALILFHDIIKISVPEYGKIIFRKEDYS